MNALETGGWSDPDDDDLFYEFGVIKNGVEKPFGELQSDKSFTDIALEKGKNNITF